VARCGRAGASGDAPVTPGGGVVRAERVVLLAVVFARLAGLAQIVVALAVAWPRYPRPAAVGAVAACVWAESLLLLAASWRARAVRPAWATADTAFTVAALVLGAWLTEPRDYGSWANFMYPYSLVAVVAVGAALRRLSAVLAAMGALTAAYVLSAVVIHGDPAWNTAANATAYTANAGISWVVARELRRLGRGLDRSRVEEVAHATELGRERERARHARMLHDHVLQTLETLARDHWVADLDMRLHVAEDAAWLRRLVEGDELDGSPRPGDLLAALETVAARQERLGLSVELNGAQLRTDPRLRGGIEPRVAAALAEATCEALANVAKHAGVGRAVVQAASDHGGVAVSVVDHGGGFDPALVSRGVGLDQSIRARVEQVGGTARIESAPGSGTVVELWAPLTSGRIAAGDGERPERGFERVPHRGAGRRVRHATRRP
jgi:signal transduction histidine kinase